jgi:putative endonuclease
MPASGSAKAVRRSRERSERLAEPDANCTQERPFLCLDGYCGNSSAPDAGMPLAQTVYVIESESDPRRYYIGLTSNMDARLTAHNAGLSKYTSQFLPWRLVVRVDFARSDRAAAFERYLKSNSGRAFLRRHFR